MKLIFCKITPILRLTAWQIRGRDTRGASQIWQQHRYWQSSQGEAFYLIVITIGKQPVKSPIRKIKVNCIFRGYLYPTGMSIKKNGLLPWQDKASSFAHCTRTSFTFQRGPSVLRFPSPFSLHLFFAFLPSITPSLTYLLLLYGATIKITLQTMQCIYLCNGIAEMDWHTKQRQLSVLKAGYNWISQLHCQFTLIYFFLSFFFLIYVDYRFLLVVVLIIDFSLWMMEARLASIQTNIYIKKASSLSTLST